ncbi:threonylcarbamoyl-AMP synthase [Kroppenstedtia guangzhouensis]|jgi:L-threonylcarbamoyladenylate synthase|uniref:Threonylcarbamoyl-AMP synthase n=1 Tax=Kroppenstedtia guangzhouensis TaxID=1274356 RepID=A0ABQ1GLE6_9BACL|nr:L-threonylcarbamoyladenylate synthase [Kroppenstedtia guangzhouensis]GGA45924.1 threonylcarbamoyl-AMP synthase [Kroppenstedtia guangzhouensis]
METKHWQIDVEADLNHHPAIREAATLLREGRLVAFPTETVYGLGASATDPEAVASIYKAKGRPSDNPLIVHLADEQGLKDWVREIPESGCLLARRFWPGPLTLILPHRGNLAPQVTAGLPTVGVRIPSHPVALALLKNSGLPVAAPSANRSGKPSPTEAGHVRTDLAGRIDGILDGGATGVGVESTVVDVTVTPPVLLRPGGITLEMLREVVGEVRVDPGLQEERKSPRSPGMKYRHYAPRGEMWVITGEGEEQVNRIQQMVDEAVRSGKKTGILCTEEHASRYRADWVVVCGTRSRPDTIARELYAALRRFDEVGAQWIAAEGFPPRGVLYSVMNRLSKAAEGRVIDPDRD